MSKATPQNTPLSQLFQSAYLRDRFAAAEGQTSLDEAGEPDPELELGLLMAIATELTDHPQSVPVHLRALLERLVEVRGIKIAAA